VLFSLLFFFVFCLRFDGDLSGVAEASVAVEEEEEEDEEGLLSSSLICS